MEELIQEKLHEIEKRENCRILLAVESGSRAWGFASPDSDYDVRFIYVRDKESYLKLNRPRDVIELPINDVLDINGWDVEKALKLLHKSNPTVFEWFSSPVIYKTTPFADQFKPVMQHYDSDRRTSARSAALTQSYQAIAQCSYPHSTGRSWIPRSDRGVHSRVHWHEYLR